MRVKLLNSDSIKDTIGDKLDETPDILGRDVDRDLNMTLADLLPRVLMVLKETNRENDFVSVIKCLASGKLSMNNIALNILLDLGQYLNQQSSTQMHYSPTSLDFWVVVQKLSTVKEFAFSQDARPMLWKGSNQNIVKMKLRHHSLILLCFQRRFWLGNAKNTAST